jgi:protein-S-isoprenylcysteine O-methyltransferase Ste14
MTPPSKPSKSSTKGSGVGFVVVQAILLGLLFFGPVRLNAGEACGVQNALLQSLGYGIFIFGTIIALIAAINLGKNLTPLPRPKENAELVQTGLYRWVRHPIYFGVIVLSLGWGLIQQSTLVWLYVVIIAIFFDIKSRKEERWLVERFPAYADYQGRVRKLIPWVY